ncbi:hypothetical protein [Aliivibrio fischeri]|uniref:hypothetical protein n=1 Tax=Aliivibrio fischeri TaxID=668 RepID=UPI0007C4AC73|nr:hypothetical protein [Aliivibrio fischeri]
MNTDKLRNIGIRLFNYEIDEFLIGVSSGKISPIKKENNWNELKRKVQCNQFSDVDVRTMVEICQYEPLTLVYELLDEVKES